PLAPGGSPGPGLPLQRHRARPLRAPGVPGEPSDHGERRGRGRDRGHGRVRRLTRLLGRELAPAATAVLSEGAGNAPPPLTDHGSAQERANDLAQPPLVARGVRGAGKKRSSSGTSRDRSATQRSSLSSARANRRG